MHRLDLSNANRSFSVGLSPAGVFGNAFVLDKIDARVQRSPGKGGFGEAAVELHRVNPRPERSVISRVTRCDVEFGRAKVRRVFWTVAVRHGVVPANPSAPAQVSSDGFLAQENAASFDIDMMSSPGNARGLDALMRGDPIGSVIYFALEPAVTVPRSTRVAPTATCRCAIMTSLCQKLRR